MNVYTKPNPKTKMVKLLGALPQRGSYSKMDEYNPKVTEVSVVLSQTEATVVRVKKLIVFTKRGVKWKYN